MVEKILTGVEVLSMPMVRVTKSGLGQGVVKENVWMV